MIFQVDWNTSLLEEGVVMALIHSMERFAKSLRAKDNLDELVHYYSQFPTHEDKDNYFYQWVVKPFYQKMRTFSLFYTRAQPNPRFVSVDEMVLLDSNSNIPSVVREILEHA